MLNSPFSWWDMRSIFSFNWISIFSQGVSTLRLGNSADSGHQYFDPHVPLIANMNTENQPTRMREDYYGPHTHTVRTHGMTVARTHLHDWVILIVLVVIEVTLNVIHPFYRFVGRDMMSDLRYPLKDNTIPVWAVPIYAVLLPIVIFLFFYFRRRDVYDLHHAVLGLLFSVLVTGVLTDAIKDAVGRPRPDFFWRCFPDGKDVYDKWGDVICHGDSKVIREGHKSFPSGHTSWSFAGLGFLSLYLAGKIQAFDGKGHVAKLCLVVLPLLAAALVGISRVDDYWHHWQDVFAGGLLGLTVATFCYLQFFAPPYHAEGWGPYAFFRVLEEARATAQDLEATNSRNLQAGGGQVEIPQSERNKHASLGVSPPIDSHFVEGDIESGRK